ncbi:MAG: peptide chain release factor 2 [Oscillospiraceae bacterium]|nr:peptide chain release factor 2 [Oscillospiraceae bacterium]
MRVAMNIEFDTYKQKLNDCRPALDGLADSLNLQGLKDELERLHAMQEAPGFWDDPEKSQKIVVKTKQAETKVEKYEKMLSAWDDLMTICEMAAEEDDDSMLDELKEGYDQLTKDMESCRLETLLTGRYDKNNALMSFHAGAGGLEAQDWCSMMYRMYTRWAEQAGFTYKVMDYQEADEGGIKSADILVMGENAYGFLKGENGVHRMVRVSPFDANGRRQTSFSAIEVIPDIEDDSNDVEIRAEDYEMQVFRSSGAGGQHINKTSSAVRLIHKATGIVVSCQTERSQFQNKENCLRMLRSKLIEIKEREHLATISDIKGVQQKIEWGSQIRNYVFMPYTLVKDTRTGCETSNINAVMDGALDPFIEAYLNCLATGNWVQK